MLLGNYTYIVWKETKRSFSSVFSRARSRRTILPLGGPSPPPFACHYLHRSSFKSSTKSSSSSPPLLFCLSSQARCCYHRGGGRRRWITSLCYGPVLSAMVLPLLVVVVTTVRSVKIAVYSLIPGALLPLSPRITLKGSRMTPWRYRKEAYRY